MQSVKYLTIKLPVSSKELLESENPASILKEIVIDLESNNTFQMPKKKRNAPVYSYCKHNKISQWCKVCNSINLCVEHQNFKNKCARCRKKRIETLYYMAIELK